MRKHICNSEYCQSTYHSDYNLLSMAIEWLRTHTTKEHCSGDINHVISLLEERAEDKAHEEALSTQFQ